MKRSTLANLRIFYTDLTGFASRLIRIEDKRMLSKSMGREATQVNRPVGRRRFITGAIYAIPFFIGGTLLASVGTYLFGKQKTQPSGWSDAGDLANLKAGMPEQVTFNRTFVDGWDIRDQKSSAWVVLDNQHRVTAFSPLCTHLGCAYHWESDKKEFACPCHGSVFDVQGGVKTGPASRPLDRYSVKVEDGRLWLGPLQESQNA